MRRFRNTCIIIPLIFFVSFVHAQTRTITGRVLSGPDNQPLAGASVMVKGATAGTATDANGAFSLNVPQGPVTLVISSVGFSMLERLVDANTSTVNIALSESQGELGEVVVTALGITSKTKTLVYATQTVKPSELTEVRDPNNVINSLQGKVANAVITQGSGGPGSGARAATQNSRHLRRRRPACGRETRPRSHAFPGLPRPRGSDVGKRLGILGTAAPTAVWPAHSARCERWFRWPPQHCGIVDRCRSEQPPCTPWRPHPWRREVCM